jgi:hypothetical protein
MTSTSVLTHAPRASAWKTVPRLAAVVILLVVLSVAAFTLGRASVHARDGSSTIAPASASVQPSSGVSPNDCRLTRHVC